jgi:hypothetical protein
MLTSNSFKRFYFNKIIDSWRVRYIPFILALFLTIFSDGICLISTDYLLSQRFILCIFILLHIVALIDFFFNIVQTPNLRLTRLHSTTITVFLLFPLNVIAALVQLCILHVCLQDIISLQIKISYNIFIFGCTTLTRLIILFCLLFHLFYGITDDVW